MCLSRPDVVFSFSVVDRRCVPDVLSLWHSDGVLKSLRDYTKYIDLAIVQSNQARLMLVLYTALDFHIIWILVPSLLSLRV